MNLYRECYSLTLIRLNQLFDYLGLCFGVVQVVFHYRRMRKCPCMFLPWPRLTQFPPASNSSHFGRWKENTEHAILQTSDQHTRMHTSDRRSEFHNVCLELLRKVDEFTAIFGEERGTWQCEQFHKNLRSNGGPMPKVTNREMTLVFTRN